MACVCVTIAEALVSTAATAIVKSKEKKNGNSAVSEIRLSEKLGWLNKMLWGGSALLAFEHLWHGEITPYPPFLTAASDPAETAVMLREMSTSGVAMAVLVTCVWGAMAAVTSVISRRKNEKGLTVKGVSRS